MPFSSWSPSCVLRSRCGSTSFLGRFLPELRLSPLTDAKMWTNVPAEGDSISRILGMVNIGDRIHQHTGGELVATMKPEKTGDSSCPLQGWHVHIQVHPVDSLDLQRHMLSKNLSDRPWYAHFRLRLTLVFRD